MTSTQIIKNYENYYGDRIKIIKDILPFYSKNNSDKILLSIIFCYGNIMVRQETDIQFENNAHFMLMNADAFFPIRKQYVFYANEFHDRIKINV